MDSWVGFFHADVGLNFVVTGLVVGSKAAMTSHRDLMVQTPGLCCHEIIESFPRDCGECA